MGWLHWSEEQLLAADINTIMVGYTGMQVLLTNIFGAAKPSGAGDFISTPASSEFISTPASAEPIAVEDLPPITPNIFDSMFSAKPAMKAN